MSPFRTRCFIWLALVPLSCGTARTADWPFPEAVFRVRIVRKKASPWPATVGACRLRTGPMAATNTEFRVMTAAGDPVGHAVLWRAPGEAVTLLFDTSGRSVQYDVYAGTSFGSAAPAWNPRAGIRLETRGRPDGPLDSVDQVRALWEKARPVYGVSLVEAIHHGIHLHGPTMDFLSRYVGFLTLTQAGRYRFATMSDDASFLLIDGQLVAAWPGQHSVHGGRRAEHDGHIELTAGLHEIEYLSAQVQHGFSVGAIWQPPGETNPSLIPPGAFAPYARFEIQTHDLPPGKPPQAFFDVRMDAHVRDEDLAWIRVVCTAYGADQRFTASWDFGDGCGAEGAQVSHVFVRPGMHSVALTLNRAGKTVASLRQLIHVEPDWPQRHDWPDAVYQSCRQAVLKRDPKSMPLADLVAVCRMADRVDDKALRTRFGRACLPRADEFGPRDADVLYRLGFHFQDPEIRLYTLVEPAFRAAIRQGAADPRLAALAQLHLAGFLLHGRGDTAAARDLLDALPADVLTGGDARLLSIYRGDVWLALGLVDKARTFYQTAGTVVDRANLAYAVRRRARLEAAKESLRRGDFDSAEQIAREIEWETPVERMLPETALIMIRAHIGRKELPFALSRSHILLQSIPSGRAHADLLALLVDINLQMAQTEQAREAYQRLLEKYPYEEPTARARARWPDGPTAHGPESSEPRK